MVYLVSQPYVPHSFPSTMWQTLQQLTQSCYFFAITLYKVHLKQALFLNTERIPILFSLPLFYRLFSPLLLILCNWNQVFKNGWILHSSLKADSFGGVPIPQRPPFLSYLVAITPGWAISISFPTPLQFIFFFKKRLINSPYTGTDFSVSVEQKNLFHSSAFLNLDLPETVFCRVTLQTPCFFQPVTPPITWARDQHFLKLKLLPDVIPHNHLAMNLVLGISVLEHTMLSWRFSYLRELYSACLNKE